LLQRNFYEGNAYLTQKIPANEVVLQEALQIVMGELSVKGLKPSQAKLATLIHGAMSRAVVHSAHSKFGMVVSQGVAVAVKLVGLPEEMAEKVSDSISNTLNNTYKQFK